MARRFPFPGLPTGWYVVAASDEVPPGRILERSYFGRELIVYRTASGDVRISDAHCPHMGAHLGKLGRIEGDTLVCGFHGFRYGESGQCVATAYGGPPPPRARLGLWHCYEQNGLVLTWFDEAGREPDWNVPVLPTEGWTPILWKRLRIATHPQETTENSVDSGHFTELHGFTDGAITRPLEVKGPLLTSSYQANRGVPSPKFPFMKTRVCYDVKVWGLGYSQVDVQIPQFRINARLFVMPVPIDEENIDLFLATSVPQRLGPIARVLRRIVQEIFTGEVEQDLDVWTHKAYVENPALAKGDGPIAEYRRYARQFYPQSGD